MKKLLILTIAAVILLAFVGCANTNTSEYIPDSSNGGNSEVPRNTETRYTEPPRETEPPNNGNGDNGDSNGNGEGGSDEPVYTEPPIETAPPQTPNPPPQNPGGNTNNPPQNNPILPTGVTLNHSSRSLEVGGHVNLTATVAPSNATNRNVTWESNNTAVATVVNGRVNAIGVGTATITVSTHNNRTATATITVTAPPVQTPVLPTGVTLNHTTRTLNVGGNADLVATVAPSNAADRSVTWTSSNTNVASVVNGRVTAVGAGTATITAETHNGHRATATITVNAPTPPPQNVTPARAVFNAINDERIAHGLNPLVWCQHLADVSLAHSTDRVHNPQSNPHIGSDGRDWNERAGRHVGENIGGFFPNNPTRAVNTWMNSTAHRNTILTSGWTVMGVGGYGTTLTVKFSATCC